VDAIWYFGSQDGVKACEVASCGNMKQTWCDAHVRDWTDPPMARPRVHASRTQVKNIWIPYGE